MENAAVSAIHSGDVAALNRFLSQNPSAVSERTDGERTLLHVATDWPGHFPNVRQIIRALVERGADLNAPFLGHHSETPLHWAASSDDVDALEELLALGADIEAPGSVIDGGPPLSNAVAFACWPAARRLIDHGARSTLWQASALGLKDCLDKYFAADLQPSPQEVTNAFWNACHGGQLNAARFLLARGAERNWVGHDRLTPLDAAIRKGHSDVVAWLRAEDAKQPQLR
jgi:ankyrin repeat protein